MQKKKLLDENQINFNLETNNVTPPLALFLRRKATEKMEILYILTPLVGHTHNKDSSRTDSKERKLPKTVKEIWTLRKEDEMLSVCPVR